MKRRLFGLIVSLVAASQSLARTAHAQAPAASAPSPPPAPPGYPYYPPPPGTAAAPYAGLPPTGPGPVIRLLSDRPEARLQQLQLKWIDVCTTPCDRAVDPRALYRIGGGSVSKSDPFQLPRAEGTVTISAQTGSLTKKWVGFGMGIAGAAATAYGGLFYLFGSAFRNADSDGNDVFGSFGRSYQILGGVFVLAGAALMLIGFPMMAAQRTAVEVR